MARNTYYILCVWSKDSQTFFVYYGDSSRKAVEEAIERKRTDEPKDWFRIVEFDGSAEDMICKLEELVPPKKPGKSRFVARK